ncbi:MAG TPA: hypothetical protein VFP34_01565 [Microlunatus sp.]|nr:hypothetical protein [Microlunatus sp.]
MTRWVNRQGPVVAEVAGWSVERTSAEVMAAVHSLSWAAPHLFGDRLAAFDADLAALLRETSPSGRFAERMPPIRVDVWR